MSLAIDALILFSAIIIIWLGAKRGFIRSFMGLISGVVSAVAAYAFTPVVSEYIKVYFLKDRIAQGIAETLRSLAFDTDTDLYNLDRLAADRPEPFLDILKRYGINAGSFSDNIRGITGCTEDVVNGYAEQIAKPVTDLISSVIAFAVLFIACLFILSLLTSLLDLIFRLPVLRGANMFFGFLLGAVEAAFIVCVLASVISVLVSALGAIDTTQFGSDIIEDTVICRRIIESNITEKLISGLGWNDLGLAELGIN